MNLLLEKIEKIHKYTAEEILIRHGGSEYFAYHKEPSSKVLLMAHVDIAGKRQPVFKPINKFLYRMIGADDRLGVAIIELLLELGYKFNYLLTNYEECGAIGADYFCMAEKLDNINLIVALDRRGSSHYVKYSPVEQENQLRKYMQKVGLLEEDGGSFSDCKRLSETFKIAHVNLATGYHLEHTEEEYFNINEVEYCLYVVKNILKNEPKQKFKIKPNIPSWKVKYLYDDYYTFKI